MALPYYLDPKPKLECLLTNNYLVLDFETTSKSRGHALSEDNEILMSAWWYKGEYKSCWANEYDQHDLMADIEACDLIVAHNAKFEIHWLKRCGLNYGDKLTYCTMLGDYILAGNRRIGFSLDDCAKRWNLAGKESVVNKMMKAKIRVEDIPRNWVLEYCIQDVRIAHKLFLKQRSLLHDRGLIPVAFTRNCLTPVLASIEAQGMRLDCERVQSEHEKLTLRSQEIEWRLRELVGDEVNFSSNHQMATVLYTDLKFNELRKYGKPDRNAPNKQFPEGMPKTDLATIRALKPTNKKQREVQELLVEWSKVSAALTKNLTLFKALCEQADGIFTGDYMQHRTATHRLSATGRKQPLEIDGKVQEKGAQLQNIPRQYKSLFVGREGRYIVETDYAQLEWRIAGILGKDEQLKQDVLDQVDVHSNCRDVLNSQGMDIDRTGAKQYSFKPQYSLPQQKENPTPAEAYAYWYKDRYSQLAKEQTKWAHDALNKKQYKTPWGLTYYFPQCKMLESGYIVDANKALNYPIQGFGGAEVMGSALIYLFWATRDSGKARLINTVHDSIEAEVEPEALGWYYTVASRCMLPLVYQYIKTVYNMDITVPLGIGFIAGTHWGKNNLTNEQICGIIDTMKKYGFSPENDEGEIKIVTYETGE